VAAVTCSLKLTGTLTELTGGKGTHGKRKTKTYKLGPSLIPRRSRGGWGFLTAGTWSGVGAGRMSRGMRDTRLDAVAAGRGLSGVRGMR
jgi:hypothetical protein